jgi:hypothetical protein
MLPFSDGIPARRFPIVNVLLIAANFAVFIFYELPQLNTAVYHASFYPCSVHGACRAPEPWGLSWGGDAYRGRIGYSQSCYNLSAVMTNSLEWMLSDDRQAAAAAGL